MRKHSVLIALVLSLLLVFSIVHAERTVWYVHPDSSLNSIQAGLDSCANNDIVLVAPSIYYENIVWTHVQGIQLISTLGPDLTIIDGNYNGSVIICTTGVDSTTIIRGFTIQNGLAYPIDFGGGIYCNGNTSPVIADNKITKNNGYVYGGGIACNNGSAPIITGNTITENTAYIGGGIFCKLSSPSITNNDIAVNTPDYGGGIACDYSSSPIISGNTITDNKAFYYGGGIWCRKSSSPTIINNTIINNRGNWYGAGIYCKESSSPTIDNCTICNNNGDGVYCSYGSYPVINYNSITDNTIYAVQNVDPGFMVDAEDNWWGDPTGPFHPGTNPGGLGDPVSDYVDFNPWLGAPIGIYEYKPTPIVTFKLKSKPNPFTNRTIIYYSLTKSGIISLKVYDQTGRLVKTLENGIKRAGNYTVSWNGYNNTNQKVPAGVYFTMLKSGDFTSVKKIILVR